MTRRFVCYMFTQIPGWSVWLAFVALGVSLALVSQAEARRLRVLLIGVTQYSALPKNKWLVGPAHDVTLLRELFTTRFGVAPGQITTLAGWPDDIQRRPTRANIVQAFARLAEQAAPEDQVVIFLAGHGSQQPAAQDSEEADGLDEIFLPADVVGWNGTTGRVENAIVDDEIRLWLEAIRRKGAFVWIIVDACHSGTITRGAPAEFARDRHIPSSELVPASTLAVAVSRPTRRGRTRAIGQISAAGLSTIAGGFVATTATQPHELTLEKPLPSPTSPVHGLFTYTLAQVLQQSLSPLTYRELVERLTTSLRRQGHLTPTPLLEGTEIDREVLGLRVWPERPRLLLGDRDLTGQYVLQAGHVHGLRPGTVLAVYPSAGAKDAEHPVGHVQVVQAEAFTSTVMPVAFAGVSAPKADRLARGWRCQVVFVDYGELRLKVALQTQEGPEAVPRSYQLGTGPQPLETALVELEGRPGTLVRRVSQGAEAEWYVRVVRDQVYLIPASGWDISLQRGTGLPDTLMLTPPQFALGSAADTVTLRERLQNALPRIARAPHLVHFTTEAGETPGTSRGLDVRVDVLRLEDARTQREDVVPFGTAGRVLYGGEAIAFRVTNPTPYTLDVTLLLLSSGYGIRTLFPRPGAEYDNRLGPQQQIRTPPFRVVEPFGPEQLVIIAMKAGTGVADFSYLEQSSLEQVMRNTTHSTLAMQSPLGQLLQHALYGQGQVRGVSKTVLETYTMRLISWMTRRASE